MAMRPYRETEPYVGFTPTVPVTAPGWRMEPPVSVPVTAGARRAATATAEPPEEPPGTCCRFQGLRAGAGRSKPTGGTAAEFARQIALESDNNARIIRSAGIKAN